MIRVKKFEQIYRENLFIMKLLVTQPEFLGDTGMIREKYKMPNTGFLTAKERDKWHDRYLRTLPLGIDPLCHSDSFYKHIQKLIKKYGLRYNFLPYIENYILENKIDAPMYNFDVSIGPDVRGIRSDKWVSIKAYAPLTKTEIREATKKLLSLQKEFLPRKVTLDLRFKMDIDLAIEIEQEMKKRKREYVEKPDGYLSEIRKHLGEKEYERVKKLRGEKVQKVFNQYTSREIAKKFFNDPNKAPRVREIHSSLQKKRSLLFG